MFSKLGLQGSGWRQMGGASPAQSSDRAHRRRVAGKPILASAYTQDASPTLAHPLLHPPPAAHSPPPGAQNVGNVPFGPHGVSGRRQQAGQLAHQALRLCSGEGRGRGGGVQEHQSASSMGLLAAKAATHSYFDRHSLQDHIDARQHKCSTKQHRSSTARQPQASLRTVLSGAQAPAGQLEEGGTHLQHQHVGVAVLVHHQHCIHGAAQALPRIPEA